jgi:hypothetical protein
MLLKNAANFKYRSGWSPTEKDTPIWRKRHRLAPRPNADYILKLLRRDLPERGGLRRAALLVVSNRQANGRWLRLKAFLSGRI